MVVRRLSLEDDRGRLIEECLAAALASRRSRAGIDVVIRLGPGLHERIWAIQVGQVGDVQVASWLETEPRAVQLEWVYPAITGRGDRANGLARMIRLYSASGGEDEDLKRWLEDMPRRGQGEPEAA